MKKLTAVICTAMMALSLTACGGNTKEVSVDPDKLAQELLTAVTSDDLSKSTMDLSTVYFYDANNVNSAVAYASSGATSCEVAVVESKDASETADVEKNFKTRVENQKNLYASYNAEEAGRLDDAIIKSAGKYTVLCVCDDTDKANEILKENGF